MKELNNITIVLVQPKYAENIGSAARAALNMGIQHLCVIGADTIDLDAARKTATHNAVHLLDKARFANHISDILTDFSLLVGTTARRGKDRRPTHWPDQLATSILPYAQANKVGLVFGPENTGLTNSELKHCGILVSIPTADFSSLNLAQSVAILCYEIRRGFWAANNTKKNLHVPQLANEQALASMYSSAAQLFKSLDSASGQAKSNVRLKHMHQLFTRAMINAKEVKLINDACLDLREALKNTKSTDTL